MGVKIEVGSCQAADDAVFPNKTQMIVIRLHRNHESLFEGYVHSAGDDPAATFIVARSPILDVGSPRALALARESLDGCERDHPNCVSLSALEDPLLPTRLVDCTDPEHPHLAITPPGKRAKYLALSYVWGEDQPFKTTKANVADYTRGIDISFLLPTIRDAIHVTHALKFQLLWIDTLCIIQDSVEDKVIELSNMHNIYRYASLTIVAGSAAKVSEGFLQERPPLGRYMTDNTFVPDVTLPFICPQRQLSVRVSEDKYHSPTPPSTIGRISISQSHAYHWSGGTHGYTHAQGPIHLRAWCLQEYFLPARLLVFSPHTLESHCRETMRGVNKPFYQPHMTLYEMRFLSNLLFSAGQPQGAGEHRPEGSYADVLRAWTFTVMDYNRRSISYPSDKLVACGAVPALFQSVLRSDYLAGLWRSHLLQGLLWRKVLKERYFTRPAAYRAPSWSWAAVDGLVWMAPSADPDQEAVVEVVRCEVTLKTPKLPFGEVTDGFLVLRTALIRLQKLHGNEAQQSWSARCFTDDGFEVVMSSQLRWDVQIDCEDDVDRALKVWAVPLLRDREGFESHGLLVTLESDRSQSHSGADVYRRVGMFDCTIHDFDILGWEKNLRLTEIEIV